MTARFSNSFLIRFLEYILPGQECKNCDSGIVQNQGYTAQGISCCECNGLGFKPSNRKNLNVELARLEKKSSLLRSLFHTLGKTISKMSSCEKENSNKNEEFHRRLHSKKISGEITR